VPHWWLSLLLPEKLSDAAHWLPLGPGQPEHQGVHGPGWRMVNQYYLMGNVLL